VNFPIRARLALLGALVVAVTVIAFSSLMYYSISSSLMKQVDSNLALRNNSSGGPPQGGGPERQPSNAFEQVNLATSGDTYVEFLDSTGAVRFCTGFLDGKSPTIGSEVLQSAGNTVVYATVMPKPTVPVRVAVRRNTHDGEVSYVVAGQSLLPIENQLAGLRLSLALGTLLALVGASVLSWLVAGRGLRPIEHIASAAEEIGRTQDLSRRIPEPRSRDEVNSLARSFNGMLERLHVAYTSVEGALEAQRRFVAAASHELRTPLTTIRTNAQILERHPDAAPDVRDEAVADIASESERMQRLVSALLALARADSGGELSRAEMDLGQLSQTVARQARRNYPGREISLNAPQHLAYVGSEDGLRQLLWILIDNAAKHTPASASISISLGESAGGLDVEVADKGPGIPAADLGRIFDRFYRSDPARSGDGAGLGLSIASWIAKQHGGSIEARNVDGGGATFTVRLPRA
jgi:signal transduction histidine kinase